MLAAALVGLLAGLLAPPAAAHKMWPSYLHLAESAGGEVAVFWKVPIREGRPLELSPLLPARCAPLAAPTQRSDGDALRVRWTLDCGEGGLTGRAISVDGLSSTGSDVVVRIEHADGRATHGVLHPDVPALTVPAVADSPLVWAWFSVGVEHILLGADHLLFVLGLLLLIGASGAGGRRARLGSLLKTVTAFTVAHSVTLALAVLGLVRFPTASVEAVIALSILYLAVEIARSDTSDTSDSLTVRRPWLVAGICGLIHGLGFAGALSEIGLPPDNIPGALVLFNLGVEAGQLLFIAAVLALSGVGQRLFTTTSSMNTALPRLGVLYLLGTLSAFWLFQRTFAIFG